MSQPRLRASQSVSHTYVLSAKQSSRTLNFNIFCLTRPGIEPPTSRMPVECSTTTLPGRGLFGDIPAGKLLLSAAMLFIGFWVQQGAMGSGNNENENMYLEVKDFPGTLSIVPTSTYNYILLAVLPGPITGSYQTVARHGQGQGPYACTRWASRVLCKVLIP